MKKLVSLLLIIVMAISVIALASCGKKEDKVETLKLGLGSYTTVKGSNANPGETKNGSAEADVNMAAVLLDKAGKIVAVKLDVAQNKVEFTPEGVAVEKTEFKTKRELKEAYGMSNIGKVEWYLQAQTLETLLVGKTLQEVKALVGEDGKGVEAVQTAGCTVGIEDVIKAVEKAIANAVDTAATAADTLELAAVTVQDCADATAEKNGKNNVDTTFAAVVSNAQHKVVAAQTDVQQVKFAFSATGEFLTDVTAELKTKGELKEAYGMSAREKVEWYIQNTTFLAQVEGKSVAEIEALVLETGYGVEAVQSAGCTIGIDELVAAVVKAVK